MHELWRTRAVKVPAGHGYWRPPVQNVPPVHEFCVELDEPALQ